MKLLFIGDVFGSPGRKAVVHWVPQLRQEFGLDFVVANGENLVHGKGVNQKALQALLEAGVDVITTGNHAFDIADSHSLYEQEKRLLRPYNYSSAAPGRGFGIYEIMGGIQLAVVNLIGQVHMSPADNPFTRIEELLLELNGQADIIFVDMHAETTSETRAMGWYLDGKVAAVLGSHTHVPTADEEVLPQGTAYLSDAGMTGPYRSVIGIQIEPILKKFRTGVKSRFEPATDDVRLCGAIVEIEESTGLARKIERIERRMDP